MRLIDADELLNDLIVGSPAEAVRIYEQIKEQPTIDPVKHGYWINAEGYHGDCVSYGKGYYRCSCCNEVSWIAMRDKFCRCCGARMDGAAE